MTDRVIDACIDWKADRVAGSDMYSIRGITALRDQPIDLTLTPWEIITLSKMLRRVIKSDRDAFADIDVVIDR